MARRWREELMLAVLPGVPQAADPGGARQPRRGPRRRGRRRGNRPGRAARGARPGRHRAGARERAIPRPAPAPTCRLPGPPGRVVLRGHLQETEAERIVPPNPSRACLKVAAGCVYQDSRYANAFQWIELGPGEGPRRALVHFRACLHGEWTVDRSQRGCPEGQADFDLIGRPPSTEREHHRQDCWPGEPAALAGGSVGGHRLHSHPRSGHPPPRGHPSPIEDLYVDLGGSGLHETYDRRARERAVKLIDRLTTTYQDYPLLVTSRPPPTATGRSSPASPTPPSRSWTTRPSPPSWASGVAPSSRTAPPAPRPTGPSWPLRPRARPSAAWPPTPSRSPPWRWCTGARSTRNGAKRRSGDGAKHGALACAADSLARVRM
jgi:hypothetical protein